jgi:hypothetical protein
MMTFKKLVLATAFVIGGIGGLSAQAIAGTVMVSIEQEAPAGQIATFAVVEAAALIHDVTADLNQDATIPFLRAAALPEPAAWDLMMLGALSLSLGFAGFGVKGRSRRDRIPSFAGARI